MNQSQHSTALAVWHARPIVDWASARPSCARWAWYALLPERVRALCPCGVGRIADLSLTFRLHALLERVHDVDDLRSFALRLDPRNDPCGTT